jgi:transcriptional regulator with XRE-family HTH domain
MDQFEKREMGNRIRTLREKFGFTQDELADKLGLKTRTSVSSYEAGRAVPSGDSLSAIADLFGVTTDFILGRSNGREPQAEDPNEMAQTLFEADYINNVDVSRAIKTERKSQGFTQRQLADLVGVGQKTISQYETGYQEIPTKTLYKIVNALGYTYPDFLSVYDIWGGEIPEQFDGDINAYNAFKKAEEDDHWREEALKDGQRKGREVISDYLTKEKRIKKNKSNPDKLPPLSKKNERDIGKQLQNILDDLNSNTALAYDGEPMDPDTQKLVRAAIESSLHLTKQIAKQKFTPKKYRDWE